MSFRRTANTHDRWLRYCNQMEPVVAATGLPAALFRRMRVFEEFLERGIGGDGEEGHTELSQIPDSAFLALEEFVNGYFDFQSGYPAFSQERFRRFRRHG